MQLHIHHKQLQNASKKQHKQTTAQARNSTSKKQHKQATAQASNSTSKQQQKQATWQRCVTAAHPVRWRPSARNPRT
jgi:hypothetical protein